MKTFFILRHAKSSWDDPDLADFDRPLNERGLRTAEFMGKLLAERSFEPQLIVSSPAKRAAQTCSLVKEKSTLESSVVFDDRIYEASSLSLFNVLREFDDKYNSVLLIGHNPGLEELLRLLTREIQIMPTAALTKINLNIEKWSDLELGCGTFEFILRPKELMKEN